MKVAKVLTVTTLAALCFNSQPAQASDFVKNLLQQFSGTVASWDDLESRRAAAENQILQALQAGNHCDLGGALCANYFQLLR